MSQGTVGTADTKKFLYVDLLRGCAVLGVLAVHSGQDLGQLTPVLGATSNYGQLGVQLFFIASAITLCLSSSQRGEDNWRNFFIRRFFRIAPLYYFGVAFYFAWRIFFNYLGSHTLSVPSGYTPWAVVQNLLFIHGLFPSNYNAIVPGGWSISVEMTFYLLFPALFALLARSRTRDFVRLTAAVVLASAALQLLTIHVVEPRLAARGLIDGIEADDIFGYMYALVTSQIHVFLIGLAAFKFLGRPVPLRVRAVAAALIVASWYLQNQRHHSGINGLFYTTMSAAAFAVFAVHLSSVRLRRSAWTDALASIGRNSFSMYIMHFFVRDALLLALDATVFPSVQNPNLRFAIVFPLLVACTYAVARVTETWIEKPGVRLGKWLIVRPTPAGGASGHASAAE